MKKKAILLVLCIYCLLGSSFAQKKKLSKTDYVITISTEFGDMVALLYDKTPKHKENFIKLSSEGYYNGTTFHRIIPDFMIQAGDPNSKDSDPNNDGQGGPGYTIPNEICELKHVRGALSAARLGDNMNPKRESSGSQFYVVQNHAGTPHLDGAYTVFGQVIQGLDVVDKIAAQPKDYRDRPIKDIKIKVTAKKMKRKKIIKLYKVEDFYKS